MPTIEQRRRVTLDTSPSPADLLACWQALEHDPLRPKLLCDTTGFVSAQHFVAASGTSIIPCVTRVDGEPAAVAWLYNIAMLPPKMTPLSAFLAVYVLPAFRKQLVLPPCAMPFLEHVRAYGMEHLWAEVRIDNPLPGYALKAYGFRQVAVLPAWKRYQGTWQDVALYHKTLV